MFGKKKQVEKKRNEGFIFSLPVPLRKEFVTIREIVEDIKNYDERSEFKVRNNSIDSLIQYLENYKLVERKLVSFNDIENNKDSEDGLTIFPTDNPSN